MHAIGSGASTTSAIITRGLRVELRVVAPENWGAALVWFTGSKSHCAQLQAIAKARGLRFEASGLFRGGESIAAGTETSDRPPDRTSQSEQF